MLTVILIIAAAVLVSGFIVMLFITFPIAKAVYREQLVRESPSKWLRQNSCPSDEEYSAMYREAEAWCNKYDSLTTEISQQNDGLNLCGRFTDFGSDKTAVILCGRAEGCIYSYYYAEPYRKAGFNIFVMDQRAHGISEGIYSGIGFLEQNDIIKWMLILSEKHHTKEFLIHGVCIGAACAVYIASNPECPDSLRGIVVDGLYRSFYDVFIARFHMNHKPIFPVLNEIEFLIYKHTGINIRKESPKNYLPNIKVPILFIHSREDVSSLPEHVPEMVNSCPTDHWLVWMDHGAHSHVRYVNTDKYDKSVDAFIRKTIQSEN